MIGKSLTFPYHDSHTRRRPDDHCPLPVVAGQRIAKTGRYKIYPIVGSVITGGSMFAISQMTASTSATWLILLLVVAGAGLGFFVEVAVIAGQNAVDGADLGVATGALNFFKTVGGAVGASLFGTILIAGLHHETAPSTSQYVSAYHAVFIWTVPFMALSFVLAIIMREKPLSEEMIHAVEGKAELPDY